MNAFFKVLFCYCPLEWRYHSRSMNNRINRLHKRCLWIVYNDKMSSFVDLWICRHTHKKYASYCHWNVHGATASFVTKMAHMCKIEKINVPEAFFHQKHLYIRESYNFDKFSCRYKPVARAQVPSNQEQWDGLRHFFSRNNGCFELKLSGNNFFL